LSVFCTYRVTVFVTVSTVIKGYFRLTWIWSIITIHPTWIKKCRRILPSISGARIYIHPVTKLTGTYVMYLCLKRVSSSIQLLSGHKLF